ncbi:hypothetical protein DV736_g1416, partial [Chaetothyriales sp. CBS 134916]
MGTLLPPELLDTVLQQFPYRRRQIYELAILYNDTFPPPSTLVAYGIEPTHKLEVITAVLETRQVRHVLVRCAECVSPRHLLNKIFTACLTWLDQQDEADEYDRIDSVNALAINLDKLFQKQKVRIVLVLDQLDDLMGASQMLLAALVRLPDTVSSVSLLLTTASPRPLPLSHSGIPSIHFAPYSRLEALGLVAQQDPPLPSFEHDCNINNLLRTWQSFVVTVYDSLIGPTSTSFPRFEEICHKLWPCFVWPALSGQEPPGTHTKWDYGLLLVKKRMLFQAEGENALVDRLHRSSAPLSFDALRAQALGKAYSQSSAPSTPSTPSKHRLSTTLPMQPKQSAERPMLKHFSTILLLSAYLASHTPPKQDIILFSRLSSASTTKSGKVRKTPTKSPFKSPSKAAASATPATSDGGTGVQGGWREQKMAARTKNLFDVKFGSPKAFTMERLLAIVRAIHPDGVARTKGVSDRIYREMGELQRLKLVSRVDDDRGGRWRINVCREWVVSIAQAHGLTVAEWEMEEMLTSVHDMDESIHSDFHNVLRLLLQSSVELVETLQAPRQQQAPSEEHLKKVIAAILWHRKFILSYYAVIGVVVVILCGHGMRHNVQRKPNKVSSNGTGTPESSETVSSSAASTLQGAITPCGKDDHDFTAVDTPLLPIETARPSQRPRPFDLIKSFLTYQPRPVGALTSPSNVLPDNGTSLAVLFFLGVNLFYLFYRTPLSIPWIIILADRAGLLFVVNLPVLYALAAKNNQPLKFLTGWSYEGLNLFHRRLGEWMIAISVIHMLGMFTVWYTILRELGNDLGHYLSHPVVFLGIAAIFSYFTIYITSIGWFRRLYYETFLALHILFQIAALGFLYFHYPTARLFVMATLIIWAIDRLLWRISLSARKCSATLEIAPDGHTVLMHCDINLKRRLFGIRIGVHHGWLPGQHVFLTIPSMGFKYRFQTHPFTVASPAPPPNANVESWPLQLVIRSIGGFSLDLLEYARHHQHCEVILDGPHGGTDALEAAHRADRVCFVAGGSGIAVTYPLAWDIRVEDVMKLESPVSTRKPYKDGSSVMKVALRRGALAAVSEYAHLWVRQEACHENWLTMFPRAASVKQGSSTPNFPRVTSKDEAREDVADIITHTFDTRSPGCTGGRPDIKSELWGWVTLSSLTTSSSSTFLSCSGSSSSSDSHVKRYNTFGDMRKANSKPRRETICIIVSGPNGLIRDIRNISADLIRDGWDIQVWVEKFGW